MAGSELPDQAIEFVGAAGCRQGPHVLDPKVGGEFVYAPGPGGVGGVRKPHGKHPDFYTMAYKPW